LGPQCVEQVPLAQSWFDGHACPHAPQLFGSNVVSVHDAPHIF